MSNSCHYKFLVIDNKDLREINNLKRKVNQATKHPKPVLKIDAPWNNKNEQFNACNVMYDEEEKLFKMWYSVCGKSADEGGIIVEAPMKFAYATSVDGIHWEKPKLGLFEVNGSKDNNYITPEMGIYSYTVLKDHSDVPSRRYKMIFCILSKEEVWAEFHLPLCLAYSHDGIHWERPPHVNPVIRGISDGCWSFYYDAFMLYLPDECRIFPEIFHSMKATIWLIGRIKDEFWLPATSTILRKHIMFIIWRRFVMEIFILA